MSEGRIVYCGTPAVFSFLRNRRAPAWVRWLVLAAASGLATLAMLTPLLDSGRTEWHIVLPILAYTLPVAAAAGMAIRGIVPSLTWSIGAYVHLLASFVVPFLLSFVLSGRDNAPLAGKIVIVVGVVVIYGLVYWALELQRIFRVSDRVVVVATSLTIVVLAAPYIIDFSSRAVFANAIGWSSIAAVVGWLTFLGYGVLSTRRDRPEA